MVEFPDPTGFILKAYERFRYAIDKDYPYDEAVLFGLRGFQFLNGLVILGIEDFIDSFETEYFCDCLYTVNRAEFLIDRNHFHRNPNYTSDGSFHIRKILKSLGNNDFSLVEAWLEEFPGPRSGFNKPANAQCNAIYSSLLQHKTLKALALEEITAVLSKKYPMYEKSLCKYLQGLLLQDSNILSEELTVLIKGYRRQSSYFHSNGQGYKLLAIELIGLLALSKHIVSDKVFLSIEIPVNSLIDRRLLDNTLAAKVVIGKSVLEPDNLKDVEMKKFIERANTMFIDL